MLNQITGGSKLHKISCVQYRMLPKISKHVFFLPVPTEKKEKQLTCMTICHRIGSTCVKPQRCLGFTQVPTFKIPVGENSFYGMIGRETTVLYLGM